MNRPHERSRPAKGAPFKKPPLRIQPTTLWDYPSQDYGDAPQGVPGYKGATPSYVVWNLLQRYTKPKDLVVDCFAGSGTTRTVPFPSDRKAIDIGDFYADYDRIERAVGWRPSIPLREGLAATLAFYRQHGAHYWAG